jgi:class 3 adenylate cyclase
VTNNVTDTVENVEEIISIEILLQKKISWVSKIVLLIAIAGFSTYGLLELFAGVFETFIIGVSTGVLLVIPLILLFFGKVKPGIGLFIIIMSLSVLATQYFYLHNEELLGLMMIDFSVFFGLVICAALILVKYRIILFIILLVATADGIVISIISDSIPFLTKRFFLSELFILAAIAFLVYYFSYLYDAFFKKAVSESEKQRISNKELRERNIAFGRFVPRQFLQLLQKESISELTLGDQIQASMTVMFSDIRSFTAISEKMSPQESFGFLNSLLKLIGPTVRHYRGFIDKYIGDATLSIFPEKPDQAIKAAIEIQNLISLYNQQREMLHKDPITMGIGINTGDVIVGIIGEEERMEETVISDTVNLASRVEGLTKTYGAAIIITGETLESLERQDIFHYRFLDQMQVTGKILPVSLYEILDGEEQTVMLKKLKSKKVYREAWELYCDGRLDEAIKKMNAIIKYNPADKAAKFMMGRCLEYFK